VDQDFLGVDPESIVVDGEASAELFQQHLDYAIITSFPGLADSTGARVLAEIGDDRARFTDARALKAYAGSAPVTRASGRSLSVTHRHIKNNRLASVGWMWAFSASSTFEPARQHYRQRRAHGDRHAAASRHLFNKLLGQLHTAYNRGRPSTRPRHSRHRYATWLSAALRSRILTTPHRVAMRDRKRDSVSCGNSEHRTAGRPVSFLSRWYQMRDSRLCYS
jgi:hypothetical protein